MYEIIFKPARKLDFWASEVWAGAAWLGFAVGIGVPCLLESPHTPDIMRKHEEEEIKKQTHRICARTRTWV